MQMLKSIKSALGIGDKAPELTAEQIDQQNRVNAVRQEFLDSLERHNCAAVVWSNTEGDKAESGIKFFAK